MLARILELASGQEYAELARERIFAPLGMDHTLHADSRSLMPGRASPYVPGPSGIENAQFQDLSGLVGAGSVWSTARDLRRFVDAIVDGSLGPDVRQSFVRGGRLNFNGRTSGFKAWAMWDSLSGVEAIFVGNVATGAPDVLRSDLPRLAAGERVSPPSPPALRAGALPLEELRRWEGVYQLENGPRLDVRVRDGVLFSGDWILLSTQDGGMYSPRDYGLVRAVPGPDGISRLDWTQGTQTYPAERVAD